MQQAVHFVLAREMPREGRCLRLRGLPFNATEEQVAHFLSACTAVDKVVVCRRDGERHVAIRASRGAR